MVWTWTRQKWPEYAPLSVAWLANGITQLARLLLKIRLYRAYFFKHQFLTKRQYIIPRSFWEKWFRQMFVFYCSRSRLIIINKWCPQTLLTMVNPCLESSLSQLLCPRGYNFHFSDNISIYRCIRCIVFFISWVGHISKD